MISRMRLLPLAVILIAFAARLNTLGDPAFWYDEGLVGWSARLPFLETARWTAADVHPPLYFWSVTVWRWFVGESEFALRFISLAFGLLSVVTVYKIGERLQGPAVGNLAALFISLARFHIWWSQELRMYILGSMFMLFSIWLTIRIVHGLPKRNDWIAYILVSAAGLYSIYLVAFALVFESLYVTALFALYILSHRKSLTEVSLRAERSNPPVGGKEIASPRRTGALGLAMTLNKYLQWIGAQTIVVLLFLPWFLYFLTQYRTWSDSTPFDFGLFVQFYATMLAVGASLNIDQWLIPVVTIWAVVISGSLIGLSANLRLLGRPYPNPSPKLGEGREERRVNAGAARRGGWLIVMLLVLPPLTVYLGSTNQRSFFYTPRVEARYLFPFIWSFYLVLGWCAWRIANAQRLRGALAALVVVVLSSASDAQYYANRMPSDVYQSLTATLRAYRQPNDGVLLHDDRTWPIFEFYFATPNKIWKGVPNGSKIKAQDADFILADFWNQHEALWMVWNEDALRIDENHALEKWLSERAVFTREFPFGTKRLIFYARTEERAHAADALAAAARPTYLLRQTVMDGVQLIGYDQAIQRYRVGDEIVLGLYWQSERSVALYASLQDDYRHEYARQNISVTAGSSRTLVQFPITTDLAHAQYHILVSTNEGIREVARAQINRTTLMTIAPDVSIQTPREVRFQHGIRLLGYDASATTLRAGDNVQLTLYWQTAQPIAQRYKVFVHVLGAQYNPKSKNFLWGQQDQEPLNGALPTTSWGVNRVVSDPYLFRLAPDAPPGHYIVEIGWYHPTTGERLQVVDASGVAFADHVNLFEIDVR